MSVELRACVFLDSLQPQHAALVANLKILEVNAFGSFGRVHLGAKERDIMAGYGAAVAAIEGLGGRAADQAKRD